MPTYEYECRKCGHAFEKFQSITAAPVKTCPKCRARRVVRLLSGGAGIIFKGSGFYETDYKRAGAPAKKEPDAAKPGGESAPSPAKTGESGTPAAKPEKPAV